MHGAPVGKARPRVTKSGHAYTPQKTKDYEAIVRACYQSQVGRGRFPAGSRGRNDLDLAFRLLSQKKEGA